MNRVWSRVWNVVVVAMGMCWVAGCVEGAGAPAAATDPTGIVEQTVLSVSADGKLRLATSQITVAEERAQREARERQLANGAGAPAGDAADFELGSCSDGAAMWIYDNENRVPGAPPLNHKICFKAGLFRTCADLTQYNRLCFQTPTSITCVPWANATGNWIGSYWAGSDAGTYNDTAYNWLESFRPYGTNDHAQLTIARAAKLCTN